MRATCTCVPRRPRLATVILASAVLLPVFAGMVLLPGLSEERATLARPAFAGEQTSVKGIRANADSTAVVDMSELAREEALNPPPQGHHAVHKPLPGPPSKRGNSSGDGLVHGGRNHTQLNPQVSFSGTGYSGWIPPDTMGTVGPNNLMETLNGLVRITDRNGTLLKSVSLLNFWSGVGGLTEVYDPRVMFDPYNDRWISSAGANPQSSTAALLIGVSQTSDPKGAWNLYKIAADPTGTNYADAPTLGSNANWIVMQANMFTVSADTFSNSTVFVFDKADLYAGGSGLYTRLKEPSGFSDFPANTSDNTVSTMYLVESYSPGSGRLRVSTITGPVGSEVLTTGVAYPAVTSTWQGSGGTTNFAPQLGSTSKIDTDDDRIISCIYRNNSIWVSHTVFLPASGTPTRSSADWWDIDASAGNLGNVLQYGRVDDPSNNTFYAYPSIAVNANNDVLLGFSEFSASIYASGAYAFRYGTDPASTMGPVTLLKSG